MKLPRPRTVWMALLVGIGTLPAFARQDAPARMPAAVEREAGLSAPMPPRAGPPAEKSELAGADSQATQKLFSSDDAWSSLDVVPPAANERPVKRPQSASNASKSGETKPAGSAGNGWARTTGALAAVVGLIVLLAWGYRTVSRGRFSFLARGRQPGLIEIISRTALSPRQALCLVRIGPRLVLVGVSPNALQALDVIADADLAARLGGQALQQRGGGRAAEFGRCLEQEANDYERPTCKSRPETERANADAVSEALRIIDLKQKLAGTVQRLRAADGKSACARL